MARVTLIHWNRAEGEARVAQLRAGGVHASLLPPRSPPNLRAIREDPPDAIIIDLTRLPSHGREVAVLLRQSRATRLVPLVFAGGPPEKVALIRRRLPDATFAEWEIMPGAIKSAMRKRVVNPAVPPRLEGYTASPLSRKLGIKPGKSVALMNAPDGFELTEAESGGTPDIVLLFVESQEQLELQLEKTLARLRQGGALWVVYPKKASGVRTDLTQNAIREFGVALGLVDYKICAVDATWTGLCFARRK